MYWYRRVVISLLLLILIGAVIPTMAQSDSGIVTIPGQDTAPVEPQSIAPPIDTTASTIPQTGVSQASSPVDDTPGLLAPSNTNLITNPNFSNGFTDWNQFGDMSSGVSGGELRFYRHAPGWRGGVIFQNINYSVSTGAPMAVEVQLGNSSSVTKGVEVLLRDGGWQQAITCSVRIPAGAGLQTVRLQDVATFNWSSMVLAIRELSSNGQSDVRVDNVSVQYQPGAGITDYSCSGYNAPHNQNLVNNPNFSAGRAPWLLWGDFGFAWNSGVMEFYRTSGASRLAVLFADVPQHLPANAPVELSIQIGNSSPVDKDINVVLRDLQWAERFACSYTVPAYAELTTITLRGLTSQPWVRSLVQVQVLDADGESALRVDNVSVAYRPAMNVSGLECSSPVFNTNPPPATEEEEVLALVNQQRCAAGLVPLVLDTRITAAAERHSNDMAYNMNNYIDHTGTDGTNAGNRLNDAGYNWNRWGENIAAGFFSAESVFNAWWNSSGHRANMMNANFREMGLSRVDRSGSYYGAYWTQVFGNRSGANTTTCSALGFSNAVPVIPFDSTPDNGTLGSPQSSDSSTSSAPVNVPDVPSDSSVQPVKPLPSNMPVVIYPLPDAPDAPQNRLPGIGAPGQ